MGAAVVIGVAGGHAFPDYDATFGLIWGRDVAHGRVPDYTLPYGPAGHPLLTMLAALVSPLGRSGAAEVLRWVALLGAGALVAGVWRLGRELFGVAVGSVAALVLFTRTAVWSLPLLSYTDLVAAAFVVWAAVVAVAGGSLPRAGGPRARSVLVLLGFAGLLRPETWLVAAAYWAWIVWSERAGALRLLPLAAAGPLVWITWDLATAHSFLGSVTTEPGAPAATSTGGHGLTKAPESIARSLGGLLRPPAVVAALAGIGIAVALAPRRAAIPLAIGALNVLAFLIVAAANGPLEQRYLMPAAAMLALFAAYAVAGWLRPDGEPDAVAARMRGSRVAPDAVAARMRRSRVAPDAVAARMRRSGGPAAEGDPLHEARRMAARIGPLRRMAVARALGPRWRVAGIVLALGLIAYAPVDADRLADLHRRIAAANTAQSDLRELLRSEAAQCALRRGRIHVPDIRLRPFVAYWAAVAPDRVDTDPPATADLVPRDTVAQQLVSRALPDATERAPLPTPAPTPGLDPVARGDAWLLAGRCARQ